MLCGTLGPTGCHPVEMDSETPEATGLEVVAIENKLLQRFEGEEAGNGGGGRS
jgi:hypothetical protein